MKAKDWIKVTNRLPEYGEDILVAGYFDGVGDMETWFSHRSKNKILLRDNNDFVIYDKRCIITHWMSIVLPKEEEKMTNEELVREAEKRIPYNITTVKEEEAFIEDFVRGAEWMQKKMQENNEGQALLYAVEKTAERTKKETLREILNWINARYDTDYVYTDIAKMLKDKINN